MKIFFIIPDLTMGGAERVFATLLKFWDRKKDDVTLVVLRKEGIYLDMLPLDLTVIELKSSRLISAIPKLIKILRKEKPQAVLATQAHLNAALGLIRFLLPKGVYLGRETSLPSQARVLKKTSSFKEKLYKLGYRRLDGVVCPSHIVAKELEKDYGLLPYKLPVIPNPVDIEGILKSGQQACPDSVSVFIAKKPKESRFLCAVGRLEKVKGFDTLLDTLSLLPEAYNLILIGEGKERKNLEEKIKTLKLQQRVLMTGLLQNPHSVIRQCQVCMLSSKYEGFPNAVLEALVQGLPAAAFRCPGGISEIVEDGLTGVFAEPGDPVSLAKNVERLFSLDIDSKLLRNYAQNHFGGTVIAESYRNALEVRLNEKA